MRAMIAVFASMILGLLASCSGGMHMDVDDRVVSDTDTPVTDTDDIWYEMDGSDDLE